jgi:Ca2+-transporting ATPase
MSIREESDIGRLLEQLESHPDSGLSHIEAYHRLRRYGTNELERPLTPLVMVISAALFCLALGMVLVLKGEFVYTLGIVAIGACLSLLAVKLWIRYIRVTKVSRKEIPCICSGIRTGRLQQLLVYALVPGDIVRLQVGELVPADGRLIEAVNLMVQEKIFSGNQNPVAKDALSSDGSELEGFKNKVFMGSIVISGRGVFVVTQTGANTRIGKAKALARKKTK